MLLPHGDSDRLGAAASDASVGSLDDPSRDARSTIAPPVDLDLDLKNLETLGLGLDRPDALAPEGSLAPPAPRLPAGTSLDLAPIARRVSRPGSLHFFRESGGSFGDSAHHSDRGSEFEGTPGSLSSRGSSPRALGEKRGSSFGSIGGGGGGTTKHRRGGGGGSQSQSQQGSPLLGSPRTSRNLGRDYAPRDETRGGGPGSLGLFFRSPRVSSGSIASLGPPVVPRGHILCRICEVPVPEEGLGRHSVCCAALREADARASATARSGAERFAAAAKAARDLQRTRGARLVGARLGVGDGAEPEEVLVDDQEAEALDLTCLAAERLVGAEKKE